MCRAGRYTADIDDFGTRDHRYTLKRRTGFIVHVGTELDGAFRLRLLRSVLYWTSGG